eukprot:gene7097-5104_t
MKAFTSFLRHQFQEYERTKGQVDRRQFSQDPDHPHTYGSPSHAKNGVATAAKPTTVPPEVLALILEKTTQPSGPYAFAKRASGAGVSPLKRPIAPEVSENFSKAQREALEVEAQRYQQQLRLQQQQHDEVATLPPLPPSDVEKRTGPAINSAASNRLVQKYQPVRKSISGVTPRLDLSSSELSHEADVSNFYEAKNEIAEFNPLHVSTPRGTTPRGTTPVPPEASVASAPSPVPFSQPAAQSAPPALPTPLPSPSTAHEPTLSRQPSAADKLLSKYRRKSSFSLNKNAGPAATTTAIGIAAKEELLRDTTPELPGSADVPPLPIPTASSAAVTDTTTLAAAAAAAAAKRSSLSSAFPVITEPTEASLTPSPASPTANGNKMTADVPTPQRRTSFFALQNGSSRDLKAVLEASTASVDTTNKSVGEQELPTQKVRVDAAKPVEQVSPPLSEDIAPSLAVPAESIPKPATSVIEVGADSEKKVSEEQKKSPSSTPTSAAAPGRSSFLSRYQPKKRSSTSTSSNNLKADLQKEMSATPASETTSSEVAPSVSTETPASQVEVPTSHASEQIVESPAALEIASAKVEEVESVTVEMVSKTESTVPSVTTPTKATTSDDILPSLPDIPQSISDQLPSPVPTLSSQRTVPLPPPPEAESVIAILAAQSTTAQNQSLHSIASDIEVKVPFASSSAEEPSDVRPDAEPGIENSTTTNEASNPAIFSKDEDVAVSPEPSVSVANAEEMISTANEDNPPVLSVSASGPEVSLPVPEPAPKAVPEPAPKTESTPIVPTSQEKTDSAMELPVSAAVVPVEPVSISPAAFVPVTEPPAEGSAIAATASSDTAAASALPAAHRDGFEVEYAAEKTTVSSSELMRQIAASKQNEENPEVQQHESEKTSHYSKLGSAFVTSNALGRGGRGGGRGRGRGL